MTCPWHFGAVRSPNGRGLIPLLARRSQAEALLSVVSNSAIDFTDFASDDQRVLHAVIVVASSTGECAALVSKYRPPCPVVVATNNEVVIRQTSGNFAQFPLKWDKDTSLGLPEVR